MTEKKKVAVIGASYLQEPLINCIKENGYEAHVFAWAADDVGEKIADCFYPISIVDKELILEECRKIGICAICSIASDLATVTVNYVADKMGLNGNSLECTALSTNKFLMRQAFKDNALPSPEFMLVDDYTDESTMNIPYPLIVKPTDRSGSRGIRRLDDSKDIKKAIKDAVDVSLEKKALIEEYIEGNEYSIEYVSYHGKHHFLACTYKYTTGAPHFVERGQFEPADLDDATIRKIREVVEKALDALKVTNSASHSEIKVDGKGNIRIVEIGARMGGDLIGSHLVKESTGIDMVQAVLDIALDKEPDLTPSGNRNAAGVRFIIDDQDVKVWEKVKNECPGMVIQSEYSSQKTGSVQDSSDRLGYFLMSDPDPEKVLRYMPE